MPMTWNHRIVCTKEHGEEWCEVYEVYYKDGKIYSWCDAGSPCGYSAKEVRRDLRLYAEAFKKPILDCKTVRGKKKLVERA